MKVGEMTSEGGEGESGRDKGRAEEVASVESETSVGVTSATTVNLKACTPLITYLTVRRQTIGSDDLKMMSNPAVEPGGMTFRGGVSLA